jgi:hypothetical protein
VSGNHKKPNGLFGEVVSRINARGGDKFKIGLSMATESIGQDIGFTLESLAFVIQLTGDLFQSNL